MGTDRRSAPLDPGALREIVEGTSGETGQAFFDELVRHLARAIGTRCVWVTEWLEEPRRLRALSFWVGDGFHGDFEYDVEGTPCEPVIENRRLCHVPDRVVELYARDPSLAPLGAVSYMGVPLLDTDGRILGHLAVLHDAPMPEDEGVTAVFRIFASRAAAELRRLRRDRDLRDRERKLAGIIDGAMDAIIELDAGLRVTHVNSAAGRVFGRDAAGMLGRDFGDFLVHGSRERLAALATWLEREPEGRQSAWMPDGLEGRRAGGGTFPAEATLSRYLLAGQPCFAVILRNIDERLAAEERLRALAREADDLRAEIEGLHGFDEIVGDSGPLRRLLADVERVAVADTTVLITGETGTGKELIARAIHRRSGRSSKPLVTVNCAAIAAGLQESEFFGHERGAFTGATQRRDGRFKLADGGTIFLDEVGEMPPDLQAKLLRVLQEGEFEPVGGSRTLRVNVRVIAATNRDLERMAAAGAFRTDLLYRLNVFPLRLPPLRERGDDVILLAEAFARRMAERRGHATAPLTPDDRARLRRYDWPGNVRELQNVIERAFLTSTDGRRLNLGRALPDPVAPQAAMGPGAAHAGAAHSCAADPSPGDAAAGGAILTAAALLDLERANIRRALETSGGKVSGPGGAAERLGMNPNTLASRMKSLGLRRPPRARQS